MCACGLCSDAMGRQFAVKAKNCALINGVSKMYECPLKDEKQEYKSCDKHPALQQTTKSTAMKSLREDGGHRSVCHL